MTTYGDTRRDFWRSADIKQVLAAAALAANYYSDHQFRRGYLAALSVVAAAHGIEWPCSNTEVEIEVAVQS